MSRPLLISDCDEVLLHMVAPFRDWLAETQGIEFRMERALRANTLLAHRLSPSDIVVLTPRSSAARVKRRNRSAAGFGV